MSLKIKGMENMSWERIRSEVEHGGRFVIFQYCISIGVMSFKRPSPIYFIKSGESVLGKALAYSLVSLVCGWWGIPWGPIWTISTIVTNCRGGRDVTAEVLRSLNAQGSAPPGGAA